MPSQVMDQRHHMSQYSHPTLAASSFSEELRLPTERQVGFWKPESLPHHMGSKSVASSPIEKPQPIGTRMAGRLELLQPYKLRDQGAAFSLEHKLFGQERHANLPPSPWRPDQETGRQTDSSLKSAALFSDGRINPNGAYNENGLFSSSVSDIFDKKLRLTSKNGLVGQSIEKVDLNHVDDEPFELTEEIEAQIIGNLLPDDDDLLSGVLDEVGYATNANNRDDADDDIFYTGGGMELETDENKKLQEFNGSANDGVGLLNGVLNGEHPYREQPSRTLFVRNINSNVEDSELKLLFEHFGDIRALYTACKHRGFVMISYYDIRSALNAKMELQNKALRRRKLDIHYSIPKDNPSEKDINQGTIVLFNVDLSLTNDDLHKIFGDYGEIKEIRDTPQKGHHKIIEFYDVRAAEAALRALNRNDIAGKKIKLETSRLGATRRICLQSCVRKSLVYANWGVQAQVALQLLHLVHFLTRMGILQGSTNLATITSTCHENGSIQGIHSGLQTSISQFRETSFPGLSSTIPQSLSTPIGISSGATHSNQAALGEISQSLGRMNGHMNYSFQGMSALHPHSLPEVHNGVNNGVPYNLNSMTQAVNGTNSRTAEAVDNRHLHKVGSGNLNGHSFDRAEGALGFSRSGSSSVRGHQLMWNNSNNFHHHPNSPVLWPSPGSFVNNVPSRSPAQMHGVPRAPSSHMIDNVLPMHHHHVGSAPAINPSLWDRRHGYAGELTEAPNFHPGSVGSMGFPGSPQLHTMELNNIYPQTGGNCMDPTVSPAQIGGPSPQQRGPMFHGRNPMVPLPSFDSPGERMRSRRNDSNGNQSDNKKQYELDVDRIVRGDDSRTTLMIKNIPNKYTSKMLLAAIDENHKGTYDFIYLPIDFKNKCNVGYAFINMTNPQHIIPFYQTFNGKKWEKFNSEKVASLAYARIQGKSALIAHFQNSSLMNEDKRCRPILFHSDGPNAGDQEPFPMGTNIRARSGRSRASSGEESHQDISITSVNCDTSTNGVDTTGPAKDSE
uniref:RRM domain-containing protein n=1 Tax=Oryza punctata TaxID=4537 RepID=A0A0E0K0C9_ORYPU